MANESDVKQTPGAAKQTAKVSGGKPSGFIVYNPFLDSWRCVTAAGKEVLSTGTKELAQNAYPEFIVKE